MSLVDIDAMLDGNLADVEAAPDYVTPPSGIAMVSIAKVEAEEFQKIVRDEQGKDTGQKEDAIRIRITRCIEEYTEYSEDNATPVNAGSLYSDTYMYEEKGLGMFKRDAAAILDVESSELDDVSLREIFTALEDVEARQCIIKTTVNKRGDNEYTNTKTTILASE